MDGLEKEDFKNLNPGDLVMLSYSKDSRLYTQGFVSQNFVEEDGSLRLLHCVKSRRPRLRSIRKHQREMCLLHEGGESLRVPQVASIDKIAEAYLFVKQPVPELYEELRQKDMIESPKVDEYEHGEYISKFFVEKTVDDKKYWFTHGYASLPLEAGGMYTTFLHVEKGDSRLSIQTDAYTDLALGVQEKIDGDEPSKEIATYDDSSPGRRIIGVEQRIANLDGLALVGQKAMTILEANALFTRGLEEFRKGVEVLDLENIIGRPVVINEKKPKIVQGGFWGWIRPRIG